MPRTLSSGMLSALSSQYIRPAVFVALTFTTGPVYVWSGIGSIVWNSQTWIGLGTLMSLSGSEDGTTVEARGIAIMFSALDSSLLGDCLSEFKLGLPVTVYLGLFASPGSLIADPVITWSGRMDQPTIDVSGQTASVTINCESRLIDLNIAVDRRNTNEDQQLDHPGDLGLSFVAGIQEITLYWGRFPQSANNL